MATAAASPGRHRTYQYAYPHPAVTVDCVVLGYAEDALQVLLVQRAHEPGAGRWAFPGGFVEIKEPLEVAACRELAEETGLQVTPASLLPVGCFGDPDRDPRERVITVVYMCLSGRPDQPLAAGSDARQARWFSVQRPPPLAFDHSAILQAALERLREKARVGLEPLALLPPSFTWTQVQSLSELLGGARFDKRNFRRRFRDLGLFVPTGDWDRSHHRRPARLYRLNKARWRALQRAGFALIH